MFGRKKKDADAASDTDDVAIEVHRFSNEAFELAREFAQDDGSRDESKNRAREMQERLAEVVSLARTCPAERQADLNRVLADARLDLNYVLSDGTMPTSIRLARAIAD